MLLILNIALLIVTGTGVCKYFFPRDNKSGSDTVISDEADVDSEVEVPESEEQAGPARLSISSIPHDAKVFVNGYYKGKTPVEVEIVSVQSNSKFKLVLLKEGFLRWEKDIELHAGDFKEFQAELEKVEDEIH